MGDITYNHAAIQEIATDATSTSARFTAMLDDLTRELKPLHEDWTAQAAEAYTAAREQWNQAANDLSHILNQLGNAVHQGNEDMHETDKSAAHSWG